MGRVATTFLLLSTASLLSLTACSGPVEVVSADSQAVTIRHSPDAGYEASEEAQEACGQYHKLARERSTHHESTNQDFSIYDCVPE